MGAITLPLVVTRIADDRTGRLPLGIGVDLDRLRKRTDAVTLTAIGCSVGLAEGPNGTEEIWPLEYRHWRPDRG